RIAGAGRRSRARGSQPGTTPARCPPPPRRRGVREREADPPGASAWGTGPRGPRPILAARRACERARPDRRASRAQTTTEPGEEVPPGDTSRRSYEVHGPDRLADAY